MGWQKVACGRFSEDYPTERRSIRLAMWPERDRLAWEGACRPGNVFELPGPAALWSPETCRARVQAYGRYLNFLQRNALLLDIESPFDRLTPDRIALYLAEVRGLLSPHTIKQVLIELRHAAGAMMPDRDWGWIKRHPGRPSLAELRASRKIKNVFDPKVLLCKALDSLDQRHLDPITPQSSVHYRNDLIVAVQCGFAFRRRNLAGMNLGRNLIIDGEVMHVIFRHDETKNYAPIRWIVPEYLKTYLLNYLNNYRPVLLSGNVLDEVWINRRHTALKYGGLATLFDAVGRRLLGYPISCHCFRHSLATAILTEDPRKIRVASGALTHRSLRAVNQHYDMSGAAGSHRVWNELRKDLIRGRGRYHP